MKNLCGRIESQSLTGAVIQSAFDHSNFLVSDVCHRPLLGHILPQQSVEVLIGAVLPTGKGPRKVPRAAQGLVNLGMTTELFAILKVSALIEKPGAEKLQPSSVTTRATVLAFTQDKGLLQHIAKRTADRVLQVFRHRWLLAPEFVPKRLLHFRCLRLFKRHDVFVPAVGASVVFAEQVDADNSPA
jgi:hypothetical protein